MLRSRRIRANERVGLSCWGNRLSCQWHQKKCLSNYCPSHFGTLLSKNTRFFRSMNTFCIQIIHTLLCLSKGHRRVHYTATFRLWRRYFQALKFCIRPFKWHVHIVTYRQLGVLCEFIFALQNKLHIPGWFYACSLKMSWSCCVR